MEYLKREFGQNVEIIEEDELDLDATLDIGVPLATLPPPPPAPEDEVEEDPEDQIFVVVEQMPQMIGGLAFFKAETASQR